MSDLIDRESALSAFNTDINKLIVGGEENARAVENYLNGVIDNIRHLPPAELSTNLAEVGTDLISRKQAIDALKGCYCGGEDSCGEPWIYESHAIKAVEQLPPQPKKGEWEITNLGALGVFDSCSECKRVVKHKAPFYNFCPNCGADMRGEQDE